MAAEAAILPVCNPVPGQEESECLAQCTDSCSTTGECITRCTAKCQNPCGVDDLLALPVNIYNYLLGLAALVAMLFIVWGGMRMFYFGYMEDSASELEAAKLTVRRAIGGFVIIATAYLLVATLLYLLGLDRGTEGGAGFFLRSIGL